ncbi:MAG: amidohydrolase [Desulfovibrionales bacterium]|nr:amidohydrolase [Desulfovibrionales bacterium]
MSILIKKVRLKGDMVDVLIKGNRFDSIGTDIDAAAETVIDGTGKAILPSFHNAHTHAAMTLMRGYADDMELHTWLSEHIWPFEARLTEDDVYCGAKLACLEMIKSGTTFFADMYWHWKGTARAVEEMGLRAALSAAFFDFDDPARARAMKQQVMDLHALSASSSDRIQFILGPHAIYTVSEDSLRWLREYAHRHGLLVHLHLSETKKEVDDCIARHGRRPVEYLNDLGLLAPNLILVHAVWMTGGDVALLARHGVQVVHCPVSNMKLCSGQFEYGAMRRQGVAVALGTDGCSSNNNLDMIEEMKIASLLAKVTAMDPTLCPAEESLDLASVNGARMYGLEGGRIASGLLADCILVDLDHVRMVPGHNVVSNMVYSANSSCVDTTICNGRVLMRGRKVEGEEEILEQVRACVARLTGATSRGDKACS